MYGAVILLIILMLVCYTGIFLQAVDKGTSTLETGIIIGIASLTLTIFAPVVGYFVSPKQTQQ